MRRRIMTTQDMKNYVLYKALPVTDASYRYASSNEAAVHMATNVLKDSEPGTYVLTLNNATNRGVQAEAVALFDVQAQPHRVLSAPVSSDADKSRNCNTDAMHCNVEGCWHDE
jgi:hypothetical protein